MNLIGDVREVKLRLDHARNRRQSGKSGVKTLIRHLQMRFNVNLELSNAMFCGLEVFIKLLKCSPHDQCAFLLDFWQLTVVWVQSEPKSQVSDSLQRRRVQDHDLPYIRSGNFDWIFIVELRQYWQIVEGNHEPVRVVADGSMVGSMEVNRQVEEMLSVQRPSRFLVHLFAGPKDCWICVDIRNGHIFHFSVRIVFTVLELLVISDVFDRKNLLVNDISQLWGQVEERKGGFAVLEILLASNSHPIW